MNQFIDKYVKKDIHQQIFKWHLLWRRIKVFFWIKPNHHHHGIFQTVLWSKWPRNTDGTHGRCYITPFHGICDRWDLTFETCNREKMLVKIWTLQKQIQKVSYFITRQIFNILILNLFLLFSVIVHNPYNCRAKQFFTTHSQRELHTVYDIYNSILWLLSATNLPSTQI